MKNNKIFRTLGIAVILTLLVMAFPAITAYAVTGNETIRLELDEGEIGDRIYIDGWDFEVRSSVYIYFSDEEADVNDYTDELDAYEMVRTKSTNDYGEFETYFTVPDELTDGADREDVRGGDYYVYAAYSAGGKIRAIDEFTIVGGEIELDPEEGAVGTEVEISGEDFNDREDITIEYDGDEVEIQSGDEETDRYGAFEGTIIIIPPSTEGDHTITVIGEDSDIEVEAVFTVEPEITISPESGGTGTTVTVSGTGFGNRVEVTIYFNNTDMDISGDDETDRDGSFEVIFDVPVLGPGTYYVEAEDEDDNTDKVKFAIAASASLSQTSGYAGTEVTVSGTGFKVNKPITITFADVKVTTSPASVTTDSKGSFSAGFNVPSSASGTYKVKISDGVNTDEADFTVLTSASISPVTSPASPGYVGTELTVSGVGFTVGRTVTIKFDDTQVDTATVKPDGTFSATFKVPTSQHGEHTITATDGTITNQFTFTMEEAAPPIPAPLKPEMGSKAEAEAYFDWEDVTDPSGVTYTLQIASDEDFTSIVLEKKDLTDSEYTITEGEKLKPVSEKAPYYWRVKAIDGASNESEWSGTGSFYVGVALALAIPQWAIYTLFGVGGLLLGFLGFWVGRKTAYSS